MVHAVLSNNAQNEVMPMSSRRNTGGGANNVMVRHNSSDMGRIDLTPPINMPPVVRVIIIIIIGLVLGLSVT
jgi:hypothetical protein